MMENQSCFCGLLTFILLFFYVQARPPRMLNLYRKPGISSATYTVHYFQQNLDHFSFKNTSVTFQQRYLINNKSWTGANNSGPIFVYCGNEGDIEWFATNTGFMYDIAPKFGALLVFPEHRYYGKSMPFGSKEAAYKDANSLSYLTTEQALADFAVLITDLKRNLSADASPVVVFGGSYGGMLAAWFRLKYPHIAIGALASSAPILQFENIIPDDTFYRIVSADFKKESEACFKTIQGSWDRLEEIATEPSGLHKISLAFHMCRDFYALSDVFDWLESAYSYLAMVDYPYAADFMEPLPAYPIREVCKAIDESNSSGILVQIYKGMNVYYNYTGKVDCFDPDDDPHGLSGWSWQACTEMVMPMSSNPDNSLFPPYAWNYKEFEEDCLKSFGVKPRPHWITTNFGGHNVKAVLKQFASNIVFSNGLLDPWSGGSVLDNISSTIVAISTAEGAHHLDLRQSREDDPMWLIQQRVSEIQSVQQWIEEYISAVQIPLIATS